MTNYYDTCYEHEVTEGDCSVNGRQSSMSAPHVELCTTPEKETVVYKFLQETFFSIHHLLVLLLHTTKYDNEGAEGQ
jgi:hypothetical protein